MDPTIPHPTVDRDGRTFLAPVSSVPVVYPLPVDGQTLAVYEKNHHLLKEVVGSNCFYEADVRYALAADPNRRSRAVDLGCGTGTWLREMAEEFPDVRFTGIDIVNCWDRHDVELDNTEFFIDDIKGRTRFADNTFDLVHMRQMRLTVTDFSALINEAARILRPGGLLLSGEWGRYHMVDHMQLQLSTYAPAITKFNELLAEVIERNGPHTVAEDVLSLIRASGHFEDDHYVLHPFPCGQCQFLESDVAVGKAMGEQMIAHFDSLRHLCLNPWTDKELDELRVDVIEELQTKSGIMCFFYMAMARKVADR